MDVWSLPRLLPEGSQLGSPAHHIVLRRRMGCTHLLNGARAWPTRISKHTTSNKVYHVKQAGTGKKEDPAPSKDLRYLWYFPLSPICNPSPHWSIKGRAGPPTKGTDAGRISSTHTRYFTHGCAATKLSATFLIIPSETWDSSLSRLFVHPTMKNFQH